MMVTIWIVMIVGWCVAIYEHIQRRRAEAERDHALTEGQSLLDQAEHMDEEMRRLENQLGGRDAELAKLRGEVMTKTDIIRRQGSDIIVLDAKLKTANIKRSNRQ